MNMKRFFWLLLLLSVFGDIYSQSGKVVTTVTHPSVTLVTDSVCVHFSISASGLSSNYRLELTPVLYNKEESQSLTLPAARITGRHNLRSEQRKTLFGKKEQREAAVSALSVPTASVDDTLHYTTFLPYAAWMNGASLRVDSYMRGCCNSQMLLPVVVASDLALVLPQPPATQPEMERTVMTVLSPAQELAKIETFIYPMDNYSNDKKNGRFFLDKDALRIYFAQSKSDIDPTFRDNTTTLRRLEHALDVMTADSVLHVEKVLIVGYASIEGTVDFNYRLAGARAKQLVEISIAHGIRPEQIEVLNMGEGWDELRHLVATTDSVPYRDEVLHIIDTVPVMKGREKRLMELHRGTPYLWMLKHLFPLQRNSGYVKVYFDQKNTQ